MQYEVDPSLEIEFVEKPPQDIFCPVTTTPLLVPHLTSCCGQYLSEEAADRIKCDGGACPLCNMPSWSTLLNRHFQRTVHELRVFCPHRIRGCRWQGELEALHRHEQSCASKTSQEQVCPMHIPLTALMCALHHCILHDTVLTTCIGFVLDKTSNCPKLQYFLFFFQNITLIFTIFPQFTV